MIKLYTREGCVYCNRAKTLLDGNNIEYDEIEIGKTITRDEVIAKFPNIKTLPIVTEDEILVGGYDQLVDHLLNKQYGKGPI